MSSPAGRIRAGTLALLDRYVGYYRPYATSHADLDFELALFEEVRTRVRSSTR